ncbi:hypothetical protein OED52_10270 [Rhodococcus sp. Z13]|uniref:Uncharacterized protein n=1 Tax=Rhodococcus sacchari TaxID=2962047 RepID=A0ACD4DLM2_9NOCA|nr:PLDc N-terminal domain-containing protein [Rhodococcus sp. Z13]UYP20866.1 hypothetical protein OED52_10270 [Rhodococcus sp. Z13]
MASPRLPRKKKFSEMSRPQQVFVVVLAVVQITLASAAWIDLAKRPADKVNGSKARWALTIAVNFVGPIRYFRSGRRD